MHAAGSVRSEVVRPPYEWMTQHDFAQAVIVAGPLLFGAGQCGLDENGDVVGPDFESQLRRSFQNIEAILREADAGLEHVVKLTLYMTDADHLEIYPRVRREFFE